MVNLLCFPWSSSLSFSLLLLVIASFPFVTSLNFTFDFTGSNGVRIAQDLINQSDTRYTPDGIQLTGNISDQNVTWRVGRVLYGNQLPLWDGASGNLLASFTTHFSFKISSYPTVSSGDGLAFFLAPMSEIPTPANSTKGENLGLFNDSANRVVAVEFDTFVNDFDPPHNHIGIDVHSIKSIAFVDLDNFNMSNGINTAHATVEYDGGAMNLSVFLSYSSEDPSVVDGQSWSLSRVVDLRKYLPEEVYVGFSAATGLSAESHTILSWDFTSTELLDRKKRRSLLLVLGLIFGLGIVLCVLGLVCFVLWQRRNKQRHHAATAARLQTVFNQQRGPRSFAYQDLANATNNFAEEGKLGAGGFGAVYKGVIPSRGNDLRVAIKKIFRESKQGEKEYMSEVILFSQLRHRNLVQLIGYCHEADDFLLVYEYMPNRSLDRHLYDAHRLLGWAERHKIALGLASALLYLHEEWEQCVVHRDIKPSNVMLDPDFNVKLGDFGLARLVDHDRTAVTTVLAGTRGYIAPEYGKTGKARKQSDVFSFGVVMLEIACGRKPIDCSEVPDRINLVEWVWRLYERGACLEAADPRLCHEFDERLMETLMVVGLWCAHPDYRLRPSIRRVIGVLVFGAPLPDLPPLNVSRQEGNNAVSSSSGGESWNSISSTSYASGR